MRKKVLLGIMLSSFFLYIAFRSTDFSQVLESVRGIHIWVLLVSPVLLLLAFWFRAMRWCVLLSPMTRVPLVSLFATIMIGYLALNILPFRLGELVRVVTLGEKENLGKISILGTIVVEKVFDVLMLLAMLLFSFFFLSVSFSDQAIIWIKTFSLLGLGVLLVTLVLIITIRFQQKKLINLTRKIFFRFPGLNLRIEKGIISLGQGFSTVRTFYDLFRIIFYSFLVWLATAGYYFLLMYGFNTDVGHNLANLVGFDGSIFLIAALSFGVSVPAGPAAVGAFELAAITALFTMGVSRVLAESYAIIAHVHQFLSIGLAGLLSLYFYVLRSPKEEDKQ